MRWRDSPALGYADTVALLAPASLLLAVLAGLRPTEAVDLSRRWLDGLARGDAGALAGLSGYPLRIRGFHADSGAAPCRAGAEGPVKGLTSEPGGRGNLELADEDALRRALPCLLTDRLLVGYIPPLRGRTWPRHGNVGGTIRAIAVGALSPRLSRYRADAQALAKTHTLVQAEMSDYKGVTNTVLLAVARNVAGSPRVFAVLIDESFEGDQLGD